MMEGDPDMATAEVTQAVMALEREDGRLRPRDVWQAPPDRIAAGDESTAVPQLRPSV